MFVVSAIALIAAAVWGVWYFRTAGPWGLCVAALLAGTVIGHAFFHISVISLERLLVGGAIATYGAKWLLGIVDGRRWDWTDTLLAALLAEFAFTALIHDWRFQKGYPVSYWLFDYALPSCAYIVARHSTITAGRLRYFFIAMLMLTIYLSFTAVAEKYEQYWAVFPKHIVNSKVVEFFGRGRGPLLNPVANGIIMVLGLACSWMLFAKAKLYGKVAVLAVQPLIMMGIYCTLTRSVAIGALVALFIIFAVQLPAKLRPIALAFSIIVVTIGAGLSWQKLQSFKRDKNVSVEDMAESAKLRPALAYVAIQVFKDYPIFGCGLGQYLRVNKDYLQDRDGIDFPLQRIRPYVQHNVFLARLVECGAVGLAIFLGFFARVSWLGWKLWKNRQAPLEVKQLGIVWLCILGAYFANGMFHDVSVITMMHMFLFFIAGSVRSAFHEYRSGRLVDVRGNHVQWHRPPQTVVPIDRPQHPIPQYPRPSSTSTY